MITNHIFISKILINNYRQFKGEICVELGYSSEKNFNIIEGPNGAGKSNIYNAINWCLYGDEPQMGGKYKSEFLLNKEV